ncbi:MAG: prepilin peptidase [Singulisphaera sp.]
MSSSAPFLILLWCFAVGACVGSFLNVVAWRLPLSMSLLWPGSHCPKCQTPIRLRDNVPIFGWLMLRGRCRACREKISPRYPLVELICAAAFTALGYVELVRAGANLPGEVPELPQALLGIWLYHALLVALLIVCALFEIDLAPVPPRFVVLGLAAGLFLPQFWPALYPSDELGHMARPEYGIIGLLMSLPLGWLVAWGTLGNNSRRDRRSRRLESGIFGAPRASRPPVKNGPDDALLGKPAVAPIHGLQRRPWDLFYSYPAVALAFVGAFLGPLPVLLITFATVAILGAGRLGSLLLGFPPVRACSVLTLATLACILSWRRSADISARYDPKTALALTVASIVALSLVLLGLTHVAQRRSTTKAKTT